MASTQVNTGKYGWWRIDVDCTGQDWGGNWSYVRVRGTLGRGSSYGSYNLNSLAKAIRGTNSWDGSGGFDLRNQTEQTIIDQTFQVWHDGGGHKYVEYTIDYAATSTTTIGDPPAITAGMWLPRIPKRPSPPDQPWVSDRLGTWLDVHFRWSGDDGGSGIYTYLVRRNQWDGSGTWVNQVDDIANNGDRRLGGLTPGTRYLIRAYAKNSAADNDGWSDASPGLDVWTAHKPTQPGTPYLSGSGNKPTSVEFSWSPSTNAGLSTIDGYLVRYWTWTGSGWSGTYTDHSFSNTTTRKIEGLTPGQRYSIRVYAHNGVSDDNNGYSDASERLDVTLLSGARIKVNGAWKTAIPYVKSNGAWKMAIPYTKQSGVWKMTS